jgi:hypothetical protein
MSLVVLAALAPSAGCDRDTGTKAPSPPVESATTLPSTRGAPTTVVSGAGGKPAGAEEARQRAGATEPAPNGTQPATSQAAAKAQTQAAAAAQMTSEEATRMLDQAVTYIKQNKYELADKTLGQLEANKASLPKAIQDKLATVRTSLNAAKAGGGLQIPGPGSTR